MAIDLAPAINFAKRMLERYAIQPPIDVDALIRRYADLVYIDIPFEHADGITINLKVPGKKTRVVVNSLNPRSRQRFTLAHELGHILIPWHMGTIIDYVEPIATGSSTDYWNMEQEASRFAGELLMPPEWVQSLIVEEDNIAKVHRVISKECQTSALSAAVRLAQLLPANIVYASEVNGAVEFAGRTEGTLASPLEWEGEINAQRAYDYCQKHFTCSYGDRQLHWWVLPDKIKLSSKDRRNWREILDKIMRDIKVPSEKFAETKASISAVAAYANGIVKGSPNYGVDEVASACIQRFKDRPEYAKLVKHCDFEVFVLRKAEEFVTKQPKTADLSSQREKT